jgi:hypothetical protein
VNTDCILDAAKAFDTFKMIKNPNWVWLSRHGLVSEHYKSPERHSFFHEDLSLKFVLVTHRVALLNAITVYHKGKVRLHYRWNSKEEKVKSVLQVRIHRETYITVKVRAGLEHELVRAIL